MLHGVRNRTSWGGAPIEWSPQLKRAAGIHAFAPYAFGISVPTLDPEPDSELFTVGDYKELNYELFKFLAANNDSLKITVGEIAFWGCRHPKSLAAARGVLGLNIEWAERKLSFLRRSSERYSALAWLAFFAEHRDLVMIDVESNSEFINNLLRGGVTFDTATKLLLAGVYNYDDIITIANNDIDSNIIESLVGA